MNVSPLKEEGVPAASFLFKQGATVSEGETIVWNALREGNRKALDYIFEKYVKLLYAYGGKITKDQGIVEDAIQDLFVELWQKHAVLSATDNIKFYLFKSLRRKITRRIAVDQRKLGDHGLQDDYASEVEFSMESTIIQQQTTLAQHEQLTRGIAELSDRQREAIYLKFYEKMSYEQLAEVLDISLTSTYKLIGKAVDALRKSVRIVS